MSSGIIFGNVKFKINADNIENAFKAFKEYFADTDNIDLDSINDLSEAFFEFGFNAYYDNDNNLRDIDTVDNELDKDAEKIFYAVGRYVEPDSYIELHTDSQEHFLMKFKNRKCILLKGEVIYTEETQLSYDRATILLNEIVEHECVAKSLNDAAENLLRIGFTIDELIQTFNFDEDIVKAANETIERSGIK